MPPDRAPLFGLTRDVLTEQNLLRLYGLLMKRVRFDHEGAPYESIVPVFPGLT